MLTTAIPDNRV